MRCKSRDNIMANKGSSGYIKRLNAPKYFAIHRKEFAYVIKQNPGRHTLQKSLALTVLLNKMDLAETRSDANRIIKSGLVNVNGKIIKEPRFPVGLNDAVTVGTESYVIGINERGQIQVSKREKAKEQVYKVIGKYKDKKNQLMLRLHDGSAVKGRQDINVYDSVVLSEYKISKLIKLGSGSKCEIIDGVHVGTFGTIKEIKAGNMHKEKSVTVEPHKGEKFETLVRNIIVVE
jgi:small subunit ribosomal protein S4e